MYKSLNYQKIKYSTFDKSTTLIALILCSTIYIESVQPKLTDLFEYSTSVFLTSGLLHRECKASCHNRQTLAVSILYLNIKRLLSFNVLFSHTFPKNYGVRHELQMQSAQLIYKRHKLYSD